MPLFQAENLEVDTDGSGTALLKIDVPGRSVNVLSRQVLADLDAALDRVAAEPNFRLLILRSGKAGTFIAGADLQEFSHVASAAEATAIAEAGQRLFDKLAALPMPT